MKQDPLIPVLLFVGTILLTAVASALIVFGMEIAQYLRSML